jgi:hypothetical protein
MFCNFTVKLNNEANELIGGFYQNSNEKFYLFKVESNGESVYVLSENAEKAKNQASCQKTENFSYRKQPGYKVSCEKLMIRGNSERIIYKEPEVILREPTLDDLENRTMCYFSTETITKDNYKKQYYSALCGINNPGLAVVYNGVNNFTYDYCAVVEIVKE